MEARLYLSTYLHLRHLCSVSYIGSDVIHRRLELHQHLQNVQELRVPSRDEMEYDGGPQESF
jgi:hypothetical protein